MLPFSHSVSSSVDILNLEYNATHILASWVEPSQPNGNVTYEINITSSSLLEEKQIFVVRNLLTADIEISVEYTVEHYSRYIIILAPCTRAGCGAPSTDSFATEQGGQLATNIRL